ncbi:MAG: hypothetical protein VXY92_06705 [Planctomycetota bacterium]|nr:hypothetical protein [Planctomycetota bacterium]
MTAPACAPLAAMIFSICICSAQRVVLPSATGGVSPDPAWTLLRQADLDADARPSDPTAEPARGLVFATIAELQTQQRTDRHLLLHSPGPEAGALRLANVYAATGGATVDELLAEAAVRGIRDALEPALRRGGREVTYLSAERVDLVPAGAARLSFTIRDGEEALAHDHYILPAGGDLQYFDCTYDAEDPGARDAFDALLATFDGSAPPPPGPGGLWIGGIAGALAGVMTALFRRKRQARALAASAGGAS